MTNKHGLVPNLCLSVPLCRISTAVALFCLLGLPVVRGNSLAQWMSANFTAPELANPSISGLQSDPDGDGLANLMEYVLGSHPLVAGSSGLEMTGEGVLSLWGSASDAVILLEQSGDLTSWSVPYADLEISGRRIEFFPEDPPAGQRSSFYRLRALLRQPGSVPAPVGLGGTVGSDGVTLEWSAATGTSTLIERDDGFGYVAVAQVPPGHRAWVDGTVWAGGTFAYRATAAATGAASGAASAEPVHVVPPFDPQQVGAGTSVLAPVESHRVAGGSAAVGGWIENVPGSVFVSLENGSGAMGPRLAAKRWSTYFVRELLLPSPGFYRARVWDAPVGGRMLGESPLFEVLARPEPAGPAASAAGESWDLNFAANSHSGPAGVIEQPFAGSLVSFSRNSPGLAQSGGPFGPFLAFAAGQPRRTDRGLLLEPERINALPNNSMSGAGVGAPGSLPTGWIETTPASNGLTREVVATGTADPVFSLPYIDIRFRGTANAAVTYRLQFHPTGNIGATVAGRPFLENGARFAAGAWVGVLDGTLFPSPAPGATLSTFQIQTCGILARTYIAASGQSNVYSEPLMPEDTGLQPWRLIARSPVLSNLSASSRLNCGIELQFRRDFSQDVTIRIIAPQLERIEHEEDELTSPILTSTGAAIRAADTLNLQNSLLAVLQGGSATAQVTTEGMSIRRSAVPLLLVNGTRRVLVRLANGAVESEIGSTPVTTYRSQLTNWANDHTSGVNWDAGGVRVGSTGPAWFASGKTRATAVTSASLGTGFYLKRLRLAEGAVDLEPLRHLTLETGIYGATSGAVTAAVAQKRRGRSVSIVGGWREMRVGGMVTGGLSEADVGEQAAFGGLSLQYLAWPNQRRGVTRNPVDGDWGEFVDPTLCMAWLEKLLTRHQINVFWSRGVSAATVTNRRITGWTSHDGRRIQCEYAIDASYEGDLAAVAGCTMFVGREARDALNPLNGYRSTDGFTSPSGDVGGSFSQTYDPRNILLRFAISPHQTAGAPDSGLLPMVEPRPMTLRDEADEAVMNYCFRLTFTRVPATRVPMPATPPPGYRRSHYEVLLRWMDRMAAEGRVYVDDAVTPTGNQWSITDLFKPTGWTSQVTDLNQTGPQGINLPGGSRAYPLASYSERALIWKMHEFYIRGLFYLLQHEQDPRIPAQLRVDARDVGFVSGYFTDQHEDDMAGWMPQLYVRVARRLRGDYIMNEMDIVAPDGTPAPGPSKKVLSAGSYPRDSHHVRRFAAQINGQWATVSEGNIFQIDSTTNKIFPMPVEVFTPKLSELENLAVIFAVSATHTCFGAFRMEMSLMQAGEAMGEAIAVCLEDPARPAIQAVDYSILRPRLLHAGIVAPLVN